MFLNFIKNQVEEKSIIRGGRFSNCSIIEALNLVEKIAKIKIKKNCT